MKILVTVGWSVVVAVEADEAKLSDYKASESHLSDLRETAVRLAYSNIRDKDGMVTSCEDLPALEE